MKRLPPTEASIEILTAEKESLEDRLKDAERDASQLRARFRKLADLLTAVPGLPVEAYKLMR